VAISALIQAERVSFGKVGVLGARQSCLISRHN
jgi:hypothetical protein